MIMLVHLVLKIVQPHLVIQLLRERRILNCKEEADQHRSPEDQEHRQGERGYLDLSRCIDLQPDDRTEQQAANRDRHQ
jgi:hypothetical protein